jgi:hypothetical protein
MQKSGLVGQPGCGYRPTRRTGKPTTGRCLGLPFPEGRSCVGCTVTTGKYNFPAGVARQSFAFALVEVDHDFTV